MPRPVSTWRRAALALLLCGPAACAQPMRLESDRYRLEGQGLSLAAPGGALWQRVELEGADLAFRDDGNATLGFAVVCGRPQTRPELMSRHLMIGLGSRHVIAAGAAVWQGREVWQQYFDASAQGSALRGKTVTLLAAGCSLDWVLLSRPEIFAGHEALFDAWWQSLDWAPEAER